MSLPAQLIAAYRAAIYRVNLSAQASFDLHIGQHSRPLDSWLDDCGHDIAHVLTAHNPRSVISRAADNAINHKRLRGEIAQLRSPFLLTTHIDPNSKWPTEQGFCIAGLSRHQALQLALDFQQNAILEHRHQSHTELLLTEL